MTDPTTLRKRFLESLYETLDGVISPTPYLEITGGDRVDVTFLNGRGRLPRPGTTEVTVLDIDAGSLFFDDIRPLYEGVTGIGKTYTSDALFQTVFGSDGWYPLRLSGQFMGSSPIEPFTTTVLENGIPKTHIDQTKCGKYGALFIDEINCGDQNEVFQVVDGKIHVNGDTGCLRLPIPGTDRYKRLAIIAAMNPANAEHSHARELSIASENRFLKFRFPNGVAEAASSQLDKRQADGLHEQFWARVRERTGMEGSWREIYPVIADSATLPSGLDHEAREFLDTVLGYVGHDPRETFERNAKLLKEADIEPQLVMRKGNDLSKIVEAQQTLKHGFVRRDVRKIEDLSRLLAFVRGMKDGTYDPRPTLTDVAAGIGVVLESKTITDTPDGRLMNLVNDGLAAYRKMCAVATIGYGLRRTVWQAAVRVGQEHGFAGYVGALNAGLARLNTQAESIAQTVLQSRVVSDLAVLRHFSQAHESDVTAALKEKGDGAIMAFGALYERNKSKSSVYEHRLDAIMR